ncbi:DUF4349 domain-containing protein [Chitinophaga japonensis]|uniref:Uncharacterized protein DUF4349 n=1 Tax=Chitinophaga japonensis TaxID=104662 RepID=A0A562TCJ3_CHIJA|nr:DUF4349 domain-containing protein [Chitinophaga japonensis]TWI91222.1 uncharacterized protein DUF4349 [Chitinophaga japonensis]
MRPFLYYLLVPVLTLAACQAGEHHAAREAAVYDAAADSTTFSNDMAALNSPSRKRVRSANVRCRVPDVFTATLQLEQAVNGMSGIVVESSLQNSFGPVQDLPYTRDSLKRVQLYTPTAFLTLRVPAAGLDSVVGMLTAMASFVDHRSMKEEDRTLAYLSNALKNKASGSAGITPGKQHTPLDVAAYQDAQKAKAIDRKIANLAILDDVNYATFTVQLFQAQRADIQVVVNPDRITRAGFGTAVLTAVGNGADMLRETVLFILQLWPFVLLAAIGWVIYKKRRFLAMH